MSATLDVEVTGCVQRVIEFGSSSPRIQSWWSKDGNVTAINHPQPSRPKPRNG